MGLDWLCSIKNLDTVVNEFWIRNCLQYDNVKAKVKISRGEFAGKDSRVCILCDCDYGLSYDGELCLENEFRVKSC